MVTTIRAIYEDGVFKPLEPVDLQEKQEVEITVQAEQQSTGKVANLDGIWAQYLVGGLLSYEEIDEITEGAHRKSLERTLRQISGDFESSDKADG
jgi:predicted DNA-binding antitoxin AbrB/MazE fold protein